MADTYLGGSTILVKTGGYANIGMCIYHTRRGKCRCDQCAVYKSECNGKLLSCGHYLSRTIGLVKGILPNGYREINAVVGKLKSTNIDDLVNSDEWEHHYEYIPVRKNLKTHEFELVNIRLASHFKIFKVSNDGKEKNYICDEIIENKSWDNGNGNVVHYLYFKNMDGVNVTFRISNLPISDNNSEMVVHLNGVFSKDLSLKEPTALLCCGELIMAVNSWPDLYGKFLKMIQQINSDAIKSFLSDEVKDKNADTIVESVCGDNNIDVQVSFRISYSPEKMLDKMSIILKRCGLDPCKYSIRVVICGIEDVIPNEILKFTSVATPKPKNDY